MKTFESEWINLPDRWGNTHSVMVRGEGLFRPIDRACWVWNINIYCAKCQMGWHISLTYADNVEIPEALVTHHTQACFDRAVQGLQSLPCNRTYQRSYSRKRRRLLKTGCFFK